MEQADEMMDNWVDLGCGGLMMFEEVVKNWWCCVHVPTPNWALPVNSSNILTRMTTAE